MKSKNELPPQLQAINSLIEVHPEEISFSPSEADAIVKGQDLWAYLMDIDKGTYLDNFLASLGWWVRVVHALLDVKGTGGVTRSSINLEEDAIKSRLADIMVLYPTAFKARYLVEAVGSDPTGLELVKRYVELKRYICSLVLKDFPDADLSELMKLA